MAANTLDKSGANGKDDENGIMPADIIFYHLLFAFAHF
jgi:hypothetical protein